ncbi:MAG: KilA-N domain-containing protein [Verrucomicrobiota bacterium]|nr:KilA-N domain-containing protein [Verrucomicrobiota bacterium]
MAKNKKIEIIGNDVTFFNKGNEDYISLTDLAKHKNAEYTGVVISHWLSTRYTVEFMGIWERVNNPNFNLTEFSYIKNESGSNGYVLSAKQWIQKTNAIGIVSKAGRYGGTYAHKDIAFEFATWISPELKFYLIKEFQRLKEEEQKQLGWDVKRSLTKINYRIHTDAIKENLIPPELTKQQVNIVYASEADILNMALFGKTAKLWRDENPKKKGNIRDFANVSQLVCLANLENLNAHLIQQNMPQAERLILLNNTAIQQMRLLTEDNSIKKLEGDK